MKTTDLDALLAAYVEDSPAEDALIAELDRRFEAAKAAGTLPNTDAAFERFWTRWTAAKDTVAVVFRRYLMQSGHSAADVAARFKVSDALVAHLMDKRTPFFADDVNRLVQRVAGEFGDRQGAVMLLLKEVAAYYYARSARTPTLLAARTRRP